MTDFSDALCLKADKKIKSTTQLNHEVQKHKANKKNFKEKNKKDK